MLKIELIGNVTRDAGLTRTATGKAVLVFGIAADVRGNTAGSKETEFFDVQVYGVQATVAVAKVITKGMRIYLRGDLRIRVHENEVTGKTYVNKDIYVSEMEFLPRAPRDDKKQREGD